MTKLAQIINLDFSDKMIAAACIAACLIGFAFTYFVAMPAILTTLEFIGMILDTITNTISLVVGEYRFWRYFGECWLAANGFAAM